ncbi:enoyl-CoA hydratase/isomerase family protein [Nitrococcus mobilis]|uniref:3-hydroxyisobutyryl-CoA hydrolase n=1 Tax=Nitrococcus mobilis Nb-231 TaxID=314278 RepID=A4BVU9_9GAMM|nr:enoyl-CoA hydratase/isomerase family protein [Nitrococcus mobilis]EAR20164.1 Enoyl-CoA hydratase/carnithine racemase [Nitrococcus mobilis Nb-231]
MSDQPMMFEEHRANNGRMLGFARLNAEGSLNALSQPMIDALRTQLTAWERDPAIVCVVLEGGGTKAFCAGGDVISLYDSMRTHPGGPNPVAERFFETEYRLDYLIHTYPKPVLCWGHGIIMGGGLGLMAGASHRVVTEASHIAMPEITIGLYPDIGATWFLNRMPGRVGLFLGLTGATMNAGDALYVDLADYFISAKRRPELDAALAEVNWSAEPERNRGHLARLLRGFANASRSACPQSNVREHRNLIDRVTDHYCLEDLVTQLQRHGGTNEWLAGGVKALLEGSPTSARVIFEQYRRGRLLSLKEAFMRELVMSVQFTRQHDFAEGIRARLIDRDCKPQWRPSSLAEVTDASVAVYFTSPHGFIPNPLEDLYAP